MELTTLEVEDLVATVGEVVRGDRRALLTAARTPPHKFFATLVSAWRRDGFMHPSLLYELELFEHRAARYRGVADWLQQLGLHPVKGEGLRRLYPGGVARQVGDVDCLAADRASLWAGACALVDAGWGVRALTVVQVDGELHVVIGLELPPEDPLLQGPDLVELATLAWLADGAAQAAPAGDILGVSKQVLDLALIVAEGLDRPFGIRDVVDAALLVATLEPGEFDALDDLVTTYGLARPCRGLVDAMTAAGVPMEGLPRIAANAAGRRPSVLGRLWPTSPIGAFARGLRKLSTSSEAESIRWAAERATERLGAARSLAGGLPLFGVKLSVEGEITDDVEIKGMRRGPMLVADTPVGRYALVPGAYVREEWLESVW